MSHRDLSWATEEATSFRLGALLRELAHLTLVALVIFFALRAVVLNFRISGSSMEPNLSDGDYVFVYRLAYWRHPPQRGDIVVFRYPLDPRRILVKRVIGLPGETVAIYNGQVLINGQPLAELYIAASPSYTMAPVKVGPDEVFVLGDNRNYSNDSHAWGVLKQNLIVGKVVWRFWPPDRFGPLPPATYPALAPAVPETP